MVMMLENATLMTPIRRHAEGTCVICGVSVNVNALRDELSRREYQISGLCQECQDGVFDGKDAHRVGSKKTKRFIVTPMVRRNLTIGVFNEMSRYDGGYSYVTFNGENTLRINGEVVDTYFESIEFTTRRCTAARWNSFSCTVKEL